MTKSIKPSTDASPSGNSPNSATAAGTQRYAERFGGVLASDFYRPLAQSLSVSSIGLGTYLGDATDEDDAAYVAAAREAIAGGINLIDTAINYRCQRSEQALCYALQGAMQSGAVRRDELVVCTKGGYVPLNRSAPTSRAEYQAYVQ